MPALVVVADSGEVLNIYPHRKSGREVTIREVLTPAVLKHRVYRGDDPRLRLSSEPITASTAGG